ncbi:MAG: hypothetical protein LBF22_04125 [Deltaproteobacteria bacterium]|jgi:hypothetical protein|nr:hypothetical protein [Deltaproteobacteria bacterium]
MEILIDAQGRIPEQIVSKWLKIHIPGTSVEGSYTIPSEFKEYFQDCLYPPSILFYAKAILDTTARLFNKSGAPEYNTAFPDKVKYPSLKKRIQEWKKLMEIVEIDRINKRSRVLKPVGTTRCSLALRWDEHPSWPDWNAQAQTITYPVDLERWRLWAETRSHTMLTLVK